MNQKLCLNQTQLRLSRLSAHGRDETPHAGLNKLMNEPLLWLSLGALAVQAALFLAKELQPIHFWVLTVFNWSCLFALPYAINAAYL